jgi:hypothetical protein
VTRVLSVVALAFIAGALGCTRTTELVEAPATAACAAPGPPIQLVDGSQSACAGALAAQIGRYALCACNDLVLAGNFLVGAFGTPSGSGGPPPPPGGPPPPANPWPGSHPVDGLLAHSFFAAVGTDGALRVPGHWDVPGSFISAGTGDVVLGTGGHVLGNAHLAGNVHVSSSYWITGDGYLSGDVSGGLVVGATLHAPADATVATSVQAKSTKREPVSVAPPCGCASGPAFDVGAAVAARRAKNANAFLPFSDDLLDDLETAQSVDWPCGEYYLDTIHTGDAGALELRVHGHVGIFVAGDVRLGNTLSVTLDEGATLDLVVGGSFYATGRVFGSPQTPASTRLWVGSSTVSLPDQIQFGAFVYAPAAVFSAGQGLSLSGSLFVGTLSVGGDVHISYDPALTQAGGVCGAAAPAPVQ